jgi:hypothetical protein
VAGAEGRDEYGNAREASQEERDFHAQQSNGNRSENYEQRAPAEAPRDSAPAERSEPREQRNEGSQAPLDLPPPPQAKPFVVWSSSPPADPTGTPRDE